MGTRIPTRRQWKMTMGPTNAIYVYGCTSHYQNDFDHTLGTVRRRSITGTVSESNIALVKYMSTRQKTVEKSSFVPGLGAA